MARLEETAGLLRGCVHNPPNDGMAVVEQEVSLARWFIYQDVEIEADRLKQIADNLDHAEYAKNELWEAHSRLLKTASEVKLREGIAHILITVAVVCMLLTAFMTYLATH